MTLGPKPPLTRTGPRIHTSKATQSDQARADRFGNHEKTLIFHEQQSASKVRFPQDPSLQLPYNLRDTTPPSPTPTPTQLVVSVSMEQEWRRVTVPDGGRVLPAEALTEGYRDEVEALTQRHEVAKRLGAPMAQSTVTAPRRQRQDHEALAKKSRVISVELRRTFSSSATLTCSRRSSTHTLNCGCLPIIPLFSSTAG